MVIALNTAVGAVEKRDVQRDAIGQLIECLRRIDAGIVTIEDCLPTATDAKHAGAGDVIRGHRPDLFAGGGGETIAGFEFAIDVRKFLELARVKGSMNRVEHFTVGPQLDRIFGGMRQAERIASPLQLGGNEVIRMLVREENRLHRAQVSARPLYLHQRVRPEVACGHSARPTGAPCHMLHTRNTAPASLRRRRFPVMLIP